ncbi:MAG: Rpn family recombination-promoting nuclease/putative transposase [Bacteroidales bacterium]|nr:Rpn family recombination-promoting nuclease/putative transposase [Bacteroidales bacterium]
MERYLDPKADLTFKKVFGEHPDLLISFLNAMLPIEDDEMVVEVEYLPTELVPENPLKKNSIVDVRCKDQLGRHFIVEMQMIWSDEFKQRVLFNASKAYVRQLDSSENYKLLQPVYSLNLVNEIFEAGMPTTFYHHYQLVHCENSKNIIDGLQLVFVELPKFIPRTISEKKMRVLWLRFLTEIDEKTRSVSPELMEDNLINKALTLVKESAFDEAQLLGYEKFWDTVRTEKTLIESAQLKGLAQGRAEGRAEGIAEGEQNKQFEIARNLRNLGVDTATIVKSTGLSEEDVESL